MTSNSSAKSKRSFDSNSSDNKKKRKSNQNQNPPNQKTLGMAWGSNSVSSSKSSSRRSNFTDFGSYMAIKNQKLQFQFDADADAAASSSINDSMSSGNKPLFHGVSIFVDGFTVPSSQELRGYMLKYGGRFENYFSRNRVTHIICSNLPDSKIKNLRSFSRGLPVLKPTWVLDSVAANKLLSWAPYQLDQLVDDTHKQPKLSAFFTPKTNSTVPDAKTLANCDCNVEEGGYLPKSATSEGESSCEVGESVEYSSDSNKDMPHSDEENVYGVSMEESNQEKVYGVSMEESTEEKVSESKKPESSSHDINVGEAFKSSPCKSSRSANVRLDDQDERSSCTPQIVKGSNPSHSTLGDPNFVENYFKNSRLHFIGTWRNRYRKRYSNLPNKVKTGKSTVNASSVTHGTAVIHVDMDCFFVAVVIKNQPELHDKPVAVCHSDNPRGTAEISSANYPARDYGVRAGMFVRDAKARCPHLVIVPYNFEAYEVAADQFYDILHKHCNQVQAVSCDEAFLDVKDLADVDAEHIASLIRQEIYETTGCTASAGIAENLLMARLATRKAKPNGQFIIPPEKVEGFLDELPIKALPGIGRVLEEKLKMLQIQTCGQLRMISKESLQKDFGSKTGNMLWNYSRGIDSRVVGVVQEAKSVGADVNWGVRFNNLQDSQRFIAKLCNEVSLRLQGCGVQGRTVTLKLKKKKKGAGEPAKYMGCGDCENLSHSMTIPVATDDVDVLQRISKQLFAYFHLDVKEIRGIGLHVSRLENVDMASQGNGRNSLRSWLSLASANMEEPIYPSREKTDGEVLLLDGRCGKYSTKGQVNFPPSEASLSRSTTLPNISDLDIGVIESLPPEIFSEMNVLYGGKLSEILEKNKDTDPKPSNSNNSSLARNVGGETDKGKEPLLFYETNIEKATTQNKEKQRRLQEYQSASTSLAGSFMNSHVPSVGADQTDFMPTSFSQIDNSILQQLPEELQGVILESFPALRRQEPSRSGVIECLDNKVSPKNIEDHPEEESSVSKHSLWVGHPPEWVKKFEVSNYLILNLLADLYYKSGSIDLLSPILQNVISALPLFLDASKDAGDDVVSSFYDLLQQYIDLKIKSDIEELYISFRLLKRFTEKSRFFLQLYDRAHPYLQASFSENYGGKLNV